MCARLLIRGKFQLFCYLNLIHSLPSDTTCYPRSDLSTLSTIHHPLVVPYTYIDSLDYIQNAGIQLSPIRIMLFPRSIIIGVLGLAAQALGRSSTGDKVLVVLESGITKSDYSSFWASLEGV